jgi:putative transposon-encoded protein
MMSPYFSPEKNSSIIPREIIAIHEEIALIDMHRTEHMAAYGQVKVLDQSCKYCQPHFGSEIKQEAAPEPQEEKKAKPAENNLERTVDIAGKKGQIVVPRSWAGKRVRVILL